MENSENFSENIQLPEIADEIKKMVEIDQGIIQKAHDETSEQKRTEDEWNKIVGPIRSENTQKLRKIIEKIGWPTVSKVGREASEGAWLIVQHSDNDHGFQEFCLYLMKECSEDEVEKSDIALLEDRILVAKGLPQLYGTQINLIESEREGKAVPYEIENQQQIDERRAHMGLEPLADYLKSLEEKSI